MLLPGISLGKYRIERQLGRGGMGAVFLAYDATLQRSLAIKVLESPGTDETYAQLLREARNASALNHPNICTVYEVGEANGVAFIAMEYVDGRSLRDLVDGGSLPVADAVRYGIEAADALAHAHNGGVVHRDLKAANAIVAANGRLKIVDFGLARRIDALTSDATTQVSIAGVGVVAGTPYTMAPEQVKGLAGDARTDLWALGVLLYEMLVGRRPFTGATVGELFASILREPPASWSAGTLHPLREIVHKCLAKDPVERYQHAADVRTLLEAVAAGLGRDPPSDSGVTTQVTLPPSPLLGVGTGRSGFVGREPELAQMEQAWTRAITGQRQLILLAGEPGIGKTRLASQFASTRAESGATVLVGRCDEEALVPYQPFVEALGWYARVSAEHDLRAQLAALGGGAELGPLIPELLRRVPDLPTQPAMSPEGQRYRLFEAVNELLAGASAVRPMILVFDDLHWADKPTLLMLRHVMRASNAAFLCIVGTYRDSELDRTHPLVEMLADLRRETVVARLSLRGLEEAHIKGLIDAFVGSADTSPQLARVVAGSTDGNPFFVGEMLRHLTETGSLAKLQSLSDADKNAAALGLPEGVKEVIGRRLSRLSEPCNRMLSLAAVIGRDFDIEVLEALGDVREDSLLDAIDAGVQAQLISEAPQRAGRFSFVHALIRETLYDELTATRRVRLHRRVAEAIEHLAQGRPDPPLADLAYHFVQAATADTADKAIDYATRAGDRAADALALEEAARLYDMALRSLGLKAPSVGTDVRRVDLHTRRARVFGALAQWAAAKPDLEQALRYLDRQQSEQRSEILLELAAASFWLLDLPSVERLASEALDLAEQVRRSDLAANAMGWLARALSGHGDLAGAIEMESATIARAGGARTIAHAMHPHNLYLAGRAIDGIECGVQATEMARASRDTTFTMNALSHYGLSLGGVGRYTEAAEIFGEVRQFGRKYGVLQLLARATSMTAGLHLSVFDFVEAEAVAFEARELGRSAGFLPSVVSAGIDLLLMYARQRDPGRADGLLSETSTAAVGAAGSHAWLWQLRLSQVRAELALAHRAFDTAVVEASEGIGHSLTKGRRRPKYEALGLITRARALHGLGRTRDAIADAKQGVVVARSTLDPVLLLVALDAVLAVDGDDESAAEARALDLRISSALPNETMRQRFVESEVVQRVRRL
jgi:predicted Ser/Thr protein kinase/tetratricopeptide (TPR) repeat protein